MPEVATNDIGWDDLVPGTEITTQYYLITPEDIKKEAEAYEDYNPLYSDPEFAEKTDIGSMVFPFYITLGEFDLPFRKVGSRLSENTVYAKSIRESFLPIRVGDIIAKKFYIEEKYEKRGKRFLTYRIDWINQNGELVHRHLRTSYWVGTPKPLIKYDPSGKVVV